jgi:8-oxo-dGTP pyrophosphatase MutT (NUDIX family)
MSNIFPAATAVLVRNGEQGLETLLLKRASKLNFGAGAWVFPGGRIDSDDYGDDPEDVEFAARRAAVRETQEEANLLIDQQSLLYFAHWLTPEHYHKRFATWFFISGVEANDQPVVVDNSEIVDYQWCRPEQALLDHQAKTLELMAPTFVTLTELAACKNVDQSLHQFSRRPVTVTLPKMTKTEQGVAMLYPGDQGYEQSDQQASGARNRLWVADHGWRYEKFD